MGEQEGKCVLVTGVTSGIGWAIAADLIAGGYRVAGCGRRPERLERLAEGLGPDAERFLPLEVDLRDEAAILGMFEAVRDQWDGVDVLVNNAGLGHKAPLLSGSTEAWREMLDVNVLALCICTREAVADMQRRGVDGHVVHISSMAGHRVPELGGLYAASKFAVRALTESLRQELRQAGSGTRITAVSPGFVETEFAERFHGDPAAAQATYSRFQCLRPEDVAGVVRYVIEAPAHVQIHDVLVRPTDQTS